MVWAGGFGRWEDGQQEESAPSFAHRGDFQFTTAGKLEWIPYPTLLREIKALRLLCFSLLFVKLCLF